MTKNNLQKNVAMKDSGVDWVGKIPNDWEIVPLKEIFAKRKELVGIDSEQYTLLRLSKDGVFPKSDSDGGKNPEKYDAYQNFEKGDLVFCAFDYDVTPRTIGLVQQKGMLTGAYTRLVPTKNIISKYYYYYYLALDIDKVLLHLCTGLRNSLSTHIFWKLPNPYPPKETQKRIADFLDEKTGRIEEVIEKKKKLIELLKEKRTSIITRAVTKGLDPNAKMKDSGVEWIGEIPEGWKVKKLKSLFKYHFGGTWGEEERGDKNDKVCVRIADFDFDNLKVSKSKLTIRNIPSSQSHKILSKEDILLEKSGGGEKTPVGRAVLFSLDKESVCSNFVEKMSIKNGEYSNFVKYILATLYFGKLNTKSIKQTTGIQNLDINNYLKEMISYPDIKTQKQIVVFLDEKTGKIDQAVQKIQEQIEKLKEYRASLIYHAVTGKITI